MILLYEVVIIGRFMDTESRTDSARSWRRGWRGYYLMGKVGWWERNTVSALNVTELLTYEWLK